MIALHIIMDLFLTIRIGETIKIAVTVFLAELITTAYNLFGSWLGDAVILKTFTIETLVGVAPICLANWAIRSQVYSIVMVPLCKALLKSCPAGIKESQKLRKAEAVSGEGIA